MHAHTDLEKKSGDEAAWRWLALTLPRQKQGVQKKKLKTDGSKRGDGWLLHYRAKSKVCLCMSVYLCVCISSLCSKAS
jgi:hypothetical protein